MLAALPARPAKLDRGQLTGTSKYPSRRDYENDFDECRALLEDYDSEGLVDYWPDWACQYTLALGYVLDPTSPEFAQLCRALGEAACELWLALDKRIDGKHAPTPPPPAPPQSEPVAVDAAIVTEGTESFDQIAERLLTRERLRIGPATRQATRTALRFLKEAHGDIRPAEITRAVVSEWLDLLSKRPASLTGADRQRKLRDLVSKFEGRDVPRMSTPVGFQASGAE